MFLDVHEVIVLTGTNGAVTSTQTQRGPINLQFLTEYYTLRYSEIQVGCSLQLQIWQLLLCCHFAWGLISCTFIHFETLVRKIYRVLGIVTNMNQGTGGDERPSRFRYSADIIKPQQRFSIGIGRESQWPLCVVQKREHNWASEPAEEQKARPYSPYANQP